jgi:hypothetical protein
MDDASGSSGRVRCVIRENVDPDDAHTDVGAWEIVDNRSSYRPGTLQAGWSGGRQQSKKSALALVAVEVILKRLQRTAKRDNFHRFVRTGLRSHESSF